MSNVKYVPINEMDHLNMAWMNWLSGNSEKALEELNKCPSALKSYRGRGDIRIMYTPIVFFPSLLDLVMEAGHSVVELLINDYAQNICWMQSKNALRAVAKDPNGCEWLIETLKEGFTEDQCFAYDWFDEVNTEITLEYLPFAMRDPIKNMIHELENGEGAGSGEAWTERVMNIIEALQDVGIDTGTINMTTMLEQLEQLNANQLSLEKIKNQWKGGGFRSTSTSSTSNKRP